MTMESRRRPKRKCLATASVCLYYECIKTTNQKHGGGEKLQPPPLMLLVGCSLLIVNFRLTCRRCMLQNVRIVRCRTRRSLSHMSFPWSITQQGHVSSVQHPNCYSAASITHPSQHSSFHTLVVNEDSG